MDTFASTLDQRQTCPACGSEHFGAQTSCWNCDQPLRAGAALSTARGRVQVCAGNELHAHHFNGLESPRLDHPLARVVTHPSDASLLGLCNLSNEPWRASTAAGQQHEVAPGKTCNLAALHQLDTPWGALRLEPATPES